MLTALSQGLALCLVSGWASVNNNRVDEMGHGGEGDQLFPGGKGRS